MIKKILIVFSIFLMVGCTGVNINTQTLSEIIDSEIKEPFSPKHPDYWNMLSEIILECQRLRFEKNISQKICGLPADNLSVTF